MREWRAKNLDRAREIERASQARQKASDPEAFRERGRARYRKWAEKPGSADKHRARNRAAYAEGRKTKRRGLSLTERHDYWLWHQGLCDLCGRSYPDPAVPGNWKFTVVDHDHDHCANKIGCIGCVRGQGHRVCNVVEGAVKKALEIGFITAIDGPLVKYLSDPPMQRWLRERDSREEASLAA